jgi:transposase
MSKQAKTLPDDPEELKRIILENERRYEKENELLREQIRLLLAQMFGKKSEKGSGDSDAIQIPLFDMPEPEVEMEEEEVEVPSHKRKKSGRKKLPAALPRVEVVHDIDEAEKVCGCGATLDRIGEDISEKLDVIPSVIRVIKHIRPKYVCKQCEGLDTDGPVVKIAPPPKQIIPKSIATAGLLAYIFIAKFCDALPFYRQESQFARIGAEISRANMCNWAMKVAVACQPVLLLLHQEIRSGPLINIDETTVQVLHEPDRAATTKSYMWVCRGGRPEHPGVMYHYAPSRSGDVAKVLLKGYSGVVQSDGYSGYNFLDHMPEIHHGACLAHARRKFTDAQKARGKNKKPGSVDVALGYIRKIYAIESEARRKGISGDHLISLRKDKSKQVFDDFFKWLSKKSLQVVPKSLLGKAINYTLGQWTRLLVFLDHPDMTPDNNLAENAVRPFVVGRKNWLFAGTPDGAKASADLYSLIETAKANKLEPYRYLRYLFEKLPFAESEKDFRQLLPMNLNPEQLLLPDTPTGV